LRRRRAPPGAAGVKTRRLLRRAAPLNRHESYAATATCVRFRLLYLSTVQGAEQNRLLDANSAAAEDGVSSK
jgi:hypothetical protein